MAQQDRAGLPAQELLVPAALVLHVAVWTLLPSLLNPNLPLDVVEGLSWGHAWQLGYDKHPPLSAWLLQLAAGLAPGEDWPAYLLSALCVAVAFWAVWTLARDFVSPEGAVLAVLLLEGVYYHNFTIPEFNPNVLQLPLWALSMLCFWRAVSRGSLLAWGLFGLFGALGLLTKYFTVFLIVPLGLYLVLDPLTRATWRTRGPYIAMAVALAVLSPHLVWLATHEFPTITYAMGRSGALSDSALVRHLGYPIHFLASQLLAALALGLLFWSLGRPRWNPRVSGTQARFLFAAALGPLILLLLASALLGLRLRSMWGAPMLLLMGLCAVAFFMARDIRLRRFACAWAAIFLLAPAVYAGIVSFQPYFSDKGKRVHFPGRALALEVQTAWQTQFDEPLKIVACNEWIAGNIGVHAAPRPQVYIEANSVRSPWLDDQKVRDSGAAVVWRLMADLDPADMPFGLAARFDCLWPAPPITLSWATGANLPPLRFGLAFVAPGASCRNE